MSCIPFFTIINNTSDCNLKPHSFIDKNDINRFYFAYNLVIYVFMAFSFVYLFVCVQDNSKNNDRIFLEVLHVVRD